MYHQIHKMLVEGSTFTEIANYLGLDRRTVKKYAGMNQQEYEEFTLHNELYVKLYIKLIIIHQEILNRVKQTDN